MKLSNWPGYGADIEGNVYSYKRKYVRTLKPILDDTGYPKVNLMKNGKRFTKRVHRVIAEQFLADYSESLSVNHINGIKSDNSLVNLEMVTCKENTEHAVRTGLINQKGSKNNLAKLTEQKVMLIKGLLKESALNQTQIARLFGVHFSTISLIHLNRAWTHVQSPATVLPTDVAAAGMEL